MKDRIPYVGDGADGCRRSAQIDREEADGLMMNSERWQELQDSARRWEAQAEEIEANQIGHLVQKERS